MHLVVDEGAGKQGKGASVKGGSLTAAQVVAEKGGRVPGIRKGGAKEFVVRLVQGIVRHGDARPAEENAATPRGVARGARSGRNAPKRRLPLGWKNAGPRALQASCERLDISAGECRLVQRIEPIQIFQR